MLKEHIDIMNEVEAEADRLIAKDNRAISWHIRIGLEEQGIKITTARVNYWMKKIIQRKGKYEFTTSCYSTIYTSTKTIEQ
ncbi:MAG TPA: hypothetical protein VL943_15360 [Niabella sp.]|nr:hypothetical protein [Niabella sp.]